MDNFIPLESINIASPCSADWDAMAGDSRARFCNTCQKNVYNLSDMSRAQAQALVNEKEGKLCVQYYQRADGTMLTDDCPVPLRPVRNGALRAWKSVAAAAVAVAALCSGLLVRAGDAAPKTHPAKRGVKVHSPVKAKKHVAVKRLAGKPQRLRKIALPGQPLLGSPAPLPVSSIVPPPVPAVSHPDAAPGGKKPVFRGEPQTKVIQFPRAGQPQGPGGLVGKPAPPPVRAPGPAPLRRLGDASAVMGDTAGLPPGIVNCENLPAKDSAEPAATPTPTPEPTATPKPAPRTFFLGYVATPVKPME